MSQPLKPEPKLWLRITLFVILLVLLVISPGPWPRKLIGLAFISVLTGTFRRSTITGNRLETQLVVAFVPLKLRKWRMDRFEGIAISLDEPAGCWTFLLLGPLYWIVFRVGEFVAPWIGGRYGLYLQSAKGKRVLVWQGNGDENYEDNLKLLQTASGLPLLRDRDY